MIWQLIPLSGSWCSERCISVSWCMAFWTQFAAFSLIYKFGSVRLDTVVLFHSVLWMHNTKSCTVIWNVQEDSVAGIKLALYIPFCECLSPDAHHDFALGVGGLSDIWVYYITMHCHSPVDMLLHVSSFTPLQINPIFLIW